MVFLIMPNQMSVRWAKSSQGICRGTCGWITSFFSFKKNKRKKIVLTTLFLAASLFIITWARSPAVERPLCKPASTQISENEKANSAGGLGFEFRESPVIIGRRHNGRQTKGDRRTKVPTGPSLRTHKKIATMRPS